MSASSERISSSVDSIKDINKQSDNIKNLTEISKNSRTTFIAILLAVAYSFLTIGATTDAALFSNTTASQPLPIIQTQVPIVWFYKFAPIILFLLYIYFHLYLQRFWRCVAALPLHHKDGRSLDDYIYPWIISAAFLHVEIPELNKKNKIRFLFEAAISIFLAWWLIPMILIFFWARYLPVHDWNGTILHIAIIVLSVAGAIHFYYNAKQAVNSDRLQPPPNNSNNYFLHPNTLTTIGAAFSLLVLSFCSFGSIEGTPKDECRANGSARCSFIYSGTRLLESVGFSPFSNFAGSKFAKPDNWWQLLTSDNFKVRISGLPGLDFVAKNLRYTNAEQAFLVRSDFSRAKMQWINLNNAILVEANFSAANIANGFLKNTDLRWANFSDANLYNTDLTHANLQNSRLNNTKFINSQLMGANLKYATGMEVDFTGADLRKTNLTLSQFPRAKMIDTELQYANLIRAQLESSHFENAMLQMTKLDEAIFSDSTFTDVNFERAKLNKTLIDGVKFLKVNFKNSELNFIYAVKTHFTDTNFQSATLNNADLREAVFIRSNLVDVSFDGAVLSNAVFENSVLQRANFGKSELYGTVFKNSDLSGAILSQTIGFNLAKMVGSCGDIYTKLPANYFLPLCSNKSETKK